MSTSAAGIAVGIFAAAVIAASAWDVPGALAQEERPEPSAWHSLESDGRVSGSVWLFGGLGGLSPEQMDGFASKDQFWRFDPFTAIWMEVFPESKKNPVRRHGHASAYDTDQDLHIIFGGTSPEARKTAFLADTWFYSPASNRWNSSVGCPTDGGGGGPGKKGGGGKGSGGKASGPAERWFAAMAYNPTTRGVTLFGGEQPGQSLFGDTWTLQVIDGEGCWTNEGALDSSPSPRTMAAMTWVWSRGTVVLHGGRDSRNLCDLWEWDGHAWSLINASDGPCLRDHSLAFDEISGRLIAFSGQLNPTDDSEPNLSTFFYDFITDAWTESPRLSPVEPPRAGAPAVRDVGTDSLILFGGTDGNFFFDDTWIIPLETL